ncbi:MAG: hypothetical protein FWC68_06295, partial [Oscillospiraceae bacterium]|nr:hypothetical protein [Oscillospiraceae bacterium]
RDKVIDRLNKHMAAFEEGLLLKGLDEEEREKLRKEEETTARHAITMHTIRQSDLESGVSAKKSLKNKVESEKKKMENEHNAKSEGRQALAKAKAEEKAKTEPEKQPEKEAEKADSKATTLEPVSNSQILKMAEASKLGSFVQSKPVAAVLIGKFNKDREGFQRAVTNLSSPEGGELLMTVFRAINASETNRTPEIVLLIREHNPNLFNQLDINSLAEAGKICRDQAEKWGGITESKRKAANVQSFTDVLNMDGYEDFSFGERVGWLLEAFSAQCEKGVTRLESGEKNAFDTALDTKEKVQEDEEAVITVFNDPTIYFEEPLIGEVPNEPPIDPFDFLSYEDKIALQGLRNRANEKEHSKHGPTQEGTDELIYTENRPFDDGEEQPNMLSMEEN